ncbi:NAD-glutamate dehydrogenase [Nevskia sp.]|uniref:NAD-glutamate dehydrogenase n=1 Tax=Nevskia sp. TaxID=1929292 RepID=UPI0025EFD983|nr:NAD-glutamate dehydrogenase [Nevskia sp.]
MKAPQESGLDRAQEDLLARLDAVVSQHEASNTAADAAFRSFLRRYYETAATESLTQRDDAALVATARQHWLLAQQRSAEQFCLRITPPAPGSALATLETVVADQPFLVDSLSLAIRAAGASIDWSVHPVLRLARRPDGTLVGLAERDDEPGSAVESLIHLEFEALPSAEAYARLEADCRTVLADVKRVVDDYPAALARVRNLIDSLQTVPAGANAADFDEARAFLDYLHDHHFTFFGVIESLAERSDDGRTRFRTDDASGLGLLRVGSDWAAQELIAPVAELDKYADSTRVVVVTKANLRSTIHRAELLDAVSVKRFGPDGQLAGTVRLIGLFSSEVYIDRPRHIPLIRRKAEYVMTRSRLAENSHSGKNLRDILHTLPRDELFQSNEEELFRLCMGIRSLRDRHGLRLFMRRDRYGRFYSFLVYLPRERYSRELRDEVGSTLLTLCGGTSLDRTVEFLRGDLTRVQFIVRTAPGTQLSLTAGEIERVLFVATRTWRDQLRDLLRDDATRAARFADAFPLSYAEVASPAEAAADVADLAGLSADQPLAARLIVSAPEQGPARAVGLKLFAHGTPVALSDVLPTLENFGLRVTRQDPAEVRPRDGGSLWVQQFDVSHAGCPLLPDAQREYFEAAFLAVWRGEVENDGLNRLVLGAGLSSRQVTMLRALCKYLLQTGLPYSQPYIETLLGEHADIARLLVQAFETRFDPLLDAPVRAAAAARVGQALDAALDQVASLDADRVLRAFVSVIRAALRTNAWQREADGTVKNRLSLKLDPSKIPELPLPRPMFEIWVYSPDVEGVHLRGGRVARGGLRWSDRRQDFRTEVLGLMKAQQVKNTVIVPVGAKGGFVVKKPVDSSNREAWMAQGVACYKTFLRGLLDLTDNRIGTEIVPPAHTVRYDEDDAYLVVAADKGTATFSDYANGISAEYGFWLGDAFASGGSAGYDHKKMGITARGAWESVKRHFREIERAGAPGIDIQTEPFTAVGIGDMSGDVFGNGMLLSPTMRLLAAFDHRHIFLDPNPDPAASLAERQRLFALPRSSWQDYDATLISPGGGVFPRSAKTIVLSPEVRAALDIHAEALTPNALMKAILTAPVDLLWNGGIGTYVKASYQNNAEVGDRANDAIRVSGRELRCKVIGEGGNLGCTQAGRIEYAQIGAGGAGGRINTDAIDNSAGVHTSDREVNIKIALSELTTAGELSREQRDPLLAAMTDDIARFVLRDNYVQSQAISLLHQNAPARLDDHGELMRMLEREGLLNRALEGLPDEDEIKRRRTLGAGLTRPELAVLIAYSKISLYDAILASTVPDDPFFVRDLLANFPPLLVARYRDLLSRHRLKREIIATILSNALVNRMGAGFAQLWADDHGLTRAEVLKAYATAHQIIDGDAWWQAIEALDNQAPAALQLRLMNLPIGLLKHFTGWLAGSRWAAQPVQAAVERFTAPLAELMTLLPGLLPPAYRDDWDRAEAAMQADGVPAALSQRLANSRVLGGALDISELAEAAGCGLAQTAAVYFRIGERFRLLWLFAAINDLPTTGKWQSLSRVNLRDDAWHIHRQMTAAALAFPGADPDVRIDGWIASRERAVNVAQGRLAELQAAGTRDFAGLAVAIREIGNLI